MSIVDSGRPLVSVIIPAFNAQDTLARTLDCVLAQSYGNLQVIVANDGSTDDTAALARRYSTRDSRVELINLPNSGVAGARNAALREAAGEFVAPIDADDLWHPQRVEAHVAALRNAPRSTAFAYSPFLSIDGADRVFGWSIVYSCSGRAFYRHLFVNFVANGSAMTIRTDAARAVGGYCEKLREAGIGGSEDLMLQLSLAESFEVVAVPRYLIGYRFGASSMSMNRERMYRSGISVLEHFRKRHPHAPEGVFAWARAARDWSHAIELRGAGKHAEARRLFGDAMRADPLLSGARTLQWVSRGCPSVAPVLDPTANRVESRPSFAAACAEPPALRQPNALVMRRLRRLEELEADAPTTAAALPAHEAGE